MKGKNRQALFDPDLAIFPTLAAILADPPEETVFTYANNAARKQFGRNLVGKSVVSVIAELVGNRELAVEIFFQLLSKGTEIIEGRLHGRDVQYHSAVDLKKGRIQAAIMDTTESRWAIEGFEYTAAALARASEVNDADTGNHIHRINVYAGRLADLIGQDEKFIEGVSLLAQLHDVGKIHTPPAVLRKKASLSNEEIEVMKRHPVHGANIIGDHSRLALARQIAIGHHERWDGSGYPSGLSGEMIPLAARIVTIVDVFDALVSRRPYKPAFNYEKALSVMTKGDERTDPDRHFDPRLLKTFIDNYSIFTAIHKSMSSGTAQA